MNGVTIRELREGEIPLLTDFLYEAIYVPEGMAPPPRAIVEEDALQVYVRGFGSQPADTACVAEQGGSVVGAAWARITDDYGHLDNDTPSLAIALKPEQRGQGIGTALLRALLAALHARGHAAASLSVRKANPAARLYARLGFITVRESSEEAIMRCALPVR